MKRGRKQTNGKRTSLMIDQNTLAQIESITVDPKRGRMTYGALTSIVNTLLRQWIDGFHKAEDRIAYLRAYNVPIAGLDYEEEEKEEAEEEEQQ